ncbi:MAG: type II toxin-antitoxin system YafQ family toxin [Mycoplasmataceae bacterium]|nr:type II toxin-antitoxin system YafQ family toxin [Mycoplasmataceae bacterium]
MYRIEQSRQYLLSYKVCQQKYHADIVALDQVVLILASGHKLNHKYRDHALHGPWSNFRECHIVEVSDDWLLIYAVVGSILYLVDTGSHAELFDD